MTADPQQILRILDIRGIDVRLDAGRLTAKWRHGPIPPDMAQFIRHFKPLTIVELQERDRLEQTVANAMALDDAEFRQWNREVLDAPPDSEHDRHDREALRQVRRRKQLATLAREAQAA